MKHSKLGIASLCIAVFIALSFFVMMIFGIASTRTGSQETMDSSNMLIGSCILCLTFPSLIAGSIMGLLSLFQKDTHHAVGIIGMLMNIIGFFLIIGIIFIGLMAGK